MLLTPMLSPMLMLMLADSSPHDAIRAFDALLCCECTQPSLNGGNKAVKLVQLLHGAASESQALTACQPCM